MRPLASRRFRLRAAAQSGERCRVFLSLPALLPAFLSWSEARPQRFCRRMKSEVPPAIVSRFWAWAIAAAIGGGIGRQTSKAGEIRRQVAASRPLTGWNTQPVTGSHVSVVQGSPSLQVIGELREQLPVAGSQALAVWPAP